MRQQELENYYTVEESESLNDRTRVDTMTINMGPQHPSTHGVLRLILTIEGETVVKAVPDIGFLHTGIEKTAEAKPTTRRLVLTDRMDYLAPLCNNLGYSLAVEKLLGIEDEVNDKIKYARVLLAELQRIASHLVWLGTTRWTWAPERLPLLLPRARNDPGHLRVRLRRAHDDELHLPRRLAGRPASRPSMRRYARSPMSSPRACSEYHDLLTNNQLWLDRTKGVGSI